MFRSSLYVLAGLGLGLLAPAGQAQTLSFLNKPMGRWLEELEKAPKPETRRSAAFALGRMGEDAFIAVPDLARRLRNDRDASVREMSATALGDIVVHFKGDTNRLWGQAGAALLAALQKDSSHRVKRSAAYAIGAFGKSASEALPALRTALNDRDPMMRQNAAWAIGRLGTSDRAAISDLCDRLSDDNVLVRRDAAGALGMLGPEKAQPAARPLVELVKREKDEVVRKTALEALAQLADKGLEKDAPDIYPLLESTDVDTSRGAAFVLGNIGGEAGARAVPVLRKALLDSDPGVQALAAAGLSNIGPPAAPAVGELARVLTLSKDPVARRNCALALGKLGAAARDAVPALAAALKVSPDAPKRPVDAKPYEEVREHAAEALAQIRYPDNAEAIPAVREVLRSDTNQTVRQRCVWALFNLKELDRYDLVPVLRGVLSEKGDDGLVVRYDSARVLAWALQDRAPEEARDTLLHMLNNKSLRVFNRSDSKIDKGIDESGGGKTSVRADLGGDARYMAAQALGWMGPTGYSKGVEAALREVLADAKADDKLKEKAKEALAAIGAK